MLPAQYPHLLYITRASEESSRDDYGNVVAAETTESLACECRAEAAGAGTRYQVAGGEYISVSWTVYCPTTCPVIYRGEPITIYEDSSLTTVRAAGRVLQVDPTDYHTRIWL